MYIYPLQISNTRLKHFLNAILAVNHVQLNHGVFGLSFYQKDFSKKPATLYSCLIGCIDFKLFFEI